MKTKMKTWTRVLLVCMTMSLFCVNGHSAEAKKETKECRTTMDTMELNILLKNGKLK